MGTGRASVLPEELADSSRRPASCSGHLIRGRVMPTRIAMRKGGRNSESKRPAGQERAQRRLHGVPWRVRVCRTRTGRAIGARTTRWPRVSVGLYVCRAASRKQRCRDRGGRRSKSGAPAGCNGQLGREADVFAVGARPRSPRLPIVSPSPGQQSTRHGHPLTSMPFPTLVTSAPIHRSHINHLPPTTRTGLPFPLPIPPNHLSSNRRVDESSPLSPSPHNSSPFQHSPSLTYTHSRPCSFSLSRVRTPRGSLSSQPHACIAKHHRNGPMTYPSTNPQNGLTD